MNNKGFTLVEIIIVIALLATLSIVVGLNVSKSMQNQKNKEKEEYDQKLANAACVYIDHINKDISSCTKTSNNANCLVTISELINAGLIDKTIVNPHNVNKNKVDLDPSKIRVYMENNTKKCAYVNANGD